MPGLCVYFCTNNVFVSEVSHLLTHTCLTALFSGTSWVSQYQKGKIILNFTEARDSEWQWHQLVRVSLHLAPDITTPVPHLPAAQPTASKH